MLTRRAFVGFGCIGALGTTAFPAQGIAASSCDRNFHIFDLSVAAFVTAACDCFIPATPSSPAAAAADVVLYIDRQLSSPWGKGLMAARSGAWQAGAPIPQRPTTFTPAQYVMTAARAIQRALGACRFERLAPTVQRHILEILGAQDHDLDGVPSRDFVAALLTLAVEGYFSHPEFAAGRDRISWPMAGFPGGHAAVSRQVG